MADMIISVAEKFSPFPAGRYPADGPFNGTRFRDEILIPALQAASKAHSTVIVQLDGALGYSSSFLEEVFGGLVRARTVTRDEIKNLLKVRADDIAYQPAKLDAERYLADALKSA